MAFEDLLHPWLNLYTASPQWFKNSLGRAYSALPVGLRKGRYYDGFLQEARTHSAHDVTVLASKKLAATLRWALTSVPAYRKYAPLIADIDPRNIQVQRQILQQLPLISKEDIRTGLDDFVAADAVSRFGLKTYSGGSTATPMMSYLHKGISRTKEFAFMGTFYKRVGLGERDVILALRGRTIPTAREAGGKLWMYEPISRQLMFSSDHLERCYMHHYIAAIRAWRPAFIHAYPSAVYPLARWLKEHPADDVTERIKGIMLFSENVLDHHMTLLKEVFGCPVFKHYGHTERVLMAASLADDERFFFWPQYGHLELIDHRGRPVTRAGELGEIVGTGFDNQVMSFIRYRTGDMATLDETGHPALPGFPVVRTIEGRRQEFIVCRDHRLIGVCGMGAGHSRDLMEVDSMQYEQRTPGHLILKVVSERPLSAETKQRIIGAMEAKTQGGCTAEIVEVDTIDRTLRGKHRLMIQHLDLSPYLGTATTHEPG
jgi:phenylacetate-CoA ligase